MRTKWLTRAHLDILGTIRQAARWDATKDGWIRKRAGMNTRSLRVLARIGLIESRAMTGPRGGRYVELRLTDDGRALARHVSDIIEGTATMDERGNHIRGMVGKLARFRWGNNAER